MKTLSRLEDAHQRLPVVIAAALLLYGCESAVPIGSLPPEPSQARMPEAVDPMPAGPTPSQPPSDSARQAKESWSQLSKAGRGHLKRGELAQAEDSFTRSYDLTRGFRAGDPRTRASFRNLQRVASAYLAAGDSASFARVMELLVYVSSEVPEARDAELARLLQELAATRRLQERHAEARDALLLALSILEDERGPGSAPLVAVHSQLGIAYLELGDSQAAQAEIDRASEIALAQEDPPGPLVATALMSRSKLDLALGRVDEAREALSSAVEIHEQHFGDEHPATARIVRDLALFEQETGRNEAAEQHFDRVISIWDSIPNEYYQRAQARNELAWFLVETGRPEQAEAPARSAVDMLEERQIEGQPLAAAADTLATALRNQGKNEEAETLYQQALSEGAKARGLPGWDVLAIADRYATLLEQTGRAADAEALRERWRATAPEAPEAPESEAP